MSPNAALLDSEFIIYHIKVQVGFIVTAEAAFLAHPNNTSSELSVHVFNGVHTTTIDSGYLSLWEHNTHSIMITYETRARIQSQRLR